MKVARYALIGAGFCSLGFGVAGIFLPVLPTTPFLLLSASCFMKSSDRLYAWIRSHPTLGKYITDYLTHRAITKKNKIVSISFLWAMLGATAVFATESLVVRLILACVGAGVTIHLSLMKTLKEADAPNTQNEPEHAESEQTVAGPQNRP
ncbi:MAG: YbaN family protein [Spirochaetales bacterium]|nr:YbaN family protein [Spirochaetales bacterium]